MVALQTPIARSTARRSSAQDDLRTARLRRLYALHEAPDTFDVEAAAEALAVGLGKARLFVECPSCAYEPAEQNAIPRGRCSKCGSTAWRQVWQSGRSLASTTMLA